MAKLTRSKRQFRKFSHQERIALLANGIIWTLVVWAALIFSLLQNDRLVWRWLLNTPTSAQAAPLFAPGPQVRDWQAPGPTATTNPSATPTRVVSPPQTLPEMPAATTTPTLPAPSPTVTPLPSESAPVPTSTEAPLDEEPPATEPATRPTPQPAPARSQVVEEAAITLSQPDPGLQADAISITEPLTEVAPTPIPWPAPAGPLPALTEQQLAQAPTRLLIPGVGIDTAVVPVGWSTVEEDNRLISVWQVAEYAVGWHQTSALPGQIGNTVLSGHSNVSGEVFRYLADVHEGDRIMVMVGDRSFEYEVTLTTIVKEAGEPLETRTQNARWIAETDDERLTLVTCWPYPYSTHRFIVVATPR